MTEHVSARRAAPVAPVPPVAPPPRGLAWGGGPASCLLEDGHGDEILATCELELGLSWRVVWFARGNLTRLDVPGD